MAEDIFAKWGLLVINTKFKSSQKFPAIQYAFVFVRACMCALTVAPAISYLPVGRGCEA